MFTSLTNDELVALFSTIKSGRDKVHAIFARSFAQADYNMIFEASAIMNELHAENQAR